MSHLEMFEPLVALMDRSSLTELELRHADGWRIRLSRAAPSAATPASAAPAVAARPSQPAPAAPSPAPTAALVTTKAGIAGIFCARPSPDAPPFVSVGDIVQEGQTLAIIEAMKVLNAVESDRHGRIVRILAQDQSAVDASTPLFELEALEVIHV
ncbi:acetyl-CoA carboxylase biotin carboxyl carrier protein [Diaphorobacter caeni]|uniref:acetyl-CoA carboxylase biotin carboxyl carrier protein n=1 Tax=Diaphorobacter caeni TaxID=2784387 RepID=UPI00189081F0|nr:biotin/lipoyl-containing protein [Diaphorobacter caeni]MBF5006914.1 acetyl-CoA carboxylase biotin carboxyl carrier protein [Diaphorobacter caeni]